jgi:hypothetical protein
MNRIDQEDSEMTTAKKKTAKKKTAVKKTAVKKTVTKRTASKKSAAKKTPVKKTPDRGAPASQVTAGGAGEKDLQALAMDIDRQMKVLAEMNTRVIIAKDQLADFQELISEKIKTFQQRSAADSAAGHKDVMTRMRETKDEAARMIKDSKALHETYETLAKHFEKGRLAAATEMKKAETAFLEKFRVIEERVLKKAGEIKKNLKN